MNNQSSVPILHLEKVSLQGTFVSDWLLQNISFKIHPGEIVGIVGASGAGKTSLLRLLNRLVSHCQGEIYIQNILVEQLPTAPLRRRIVLAAQEPKLLGMNVIDALSYPLRLQQLPESEIRTEIDTWTNLLRIPPEWFYKTELQLSLGQRQLVAIARALLLRPEVILLDEPTSALDVGMAHYLLEVLHDLNQSQNLTILMVNHQLELIQQFCDRFLWLDQGGLAADVPATELNWQRIHKKIVQLQMHQEEDWI